MRNLLPVTALFGAIAMTCIAGCATNPPPRMVERDVVVMQPAPPAPLPELVPAVQAPDAYWVQGHWHWNRHQYMWIPGRWVQARPGYVLVGASWQNDAGRWVYRPEYWAPVQPAPMAMEVSVALAPPPPRVDIVTLAPSPQHFWIAGFWGWNGREHVWQPGHWEHHRPGYVYAPAHWVRAGSSYRFVGGYWRR
jgi:hypothetical protein